MNLAFSPFQQRCLDALGYTIYALIGAQTATTESLAALDRHGEKLPGAPPARPSSVIKSAPFAPHAMADAGDRRLLVAVLKAAHIQIDAIEDAYHWLAARGVSLASLRGNPAAKRALWAQLRLERRAQ